MRAILYWLLRSGLTPVLPAQRRIPMISFRLFATAALLGASTLAIAATPANAAPCRDAKGHFAKCNGTNYPVVARNAARRAAPVRTIAHSAAPAPARTAAFIRPAGPTTGRPSVKVAAMMPAKVAPKAANATKFAAASHVAKPAAKTAVHRAKPAKALKTG